MGDKPYTPPKLCSINPRNGVGKLPVAETQGFPIASEAGVLENLKNYAV